jgi:8-oxo-dGTP pyrophosphatase MutT (NUDIX family)
MLSRVTGPERDLARLGERLSVYQPAEATAERYAAVAAIVAPAPGPLSVLLIRRAEHPLDPWSGHMAFPGGRRDPRDADLFQTACRETREEVGIDLAESGRYLGRLDDLPAIGRLRPTGLVIRPHVFALAGRPDVRPNEEVAEALWAPLDAIARGDLDTSHRFTYEARDYEMPAFDVDGRIVWGLTYRMLSSLAALLDRGA